MDTKPKNERDFRGLVNFFASIFSIIAGLLFGYFVLFLSNSKEATAGFLMILKGGFSNGYSGIAQMIYIATPIIMTGLSVGFAFKTGLFNIGASGQFIVGAFVAVYIGVKWTWLPENIHWIVAIVGAAIGGAIWGAIPGILKAFSNVNEVISSIMCNYIGTYLVNMLIVKVVYDQVRNQSLPVYKAANIPRFGLDKLFNGENVNIAIIIAIFIAILIYILLEKTTIGYELKACGKNFNASKYAGINHKKNIVLAMVIAGALAGIGGGFLYLANSGKYIQVLDKIAPEGFSGISVALFGLSHPIGILLSALFIAHITVGGYNLQLLSFYPEIIDIIIASILYFGAFSLLFKNFILKFLNKMKKEDKKE